MEKKFDLNGKLDFNDIDLTPPENIVKDIISHISTETKGIISGEIKPYSGHIFSYTQQSSYKSIAIALGEKDKKVDIQTTLGKQNEESYSYEFYLKTPLYEQYKYRICYMRYGIGNYPVTLVLEQSIADDVFSEINANYILKCNTREDFEDLMISIVCSKRVIAVMQEMIRINQIRTQFSEETENGVDVDENVEIDENNS